MGRYANRIKDTVLFLNGKTYQLERSGGLNHLHGNYCTTLLAAQSSSDSVTFQR